jgi:two-component system, OmpR family, sensor histidine kinase ChvG
MYYYIALPIKDSEGETVLIAHLSRHTGQIIGAINRMIRSHRVAYGLSLGVAATIAVLTALTLIHPLRRLTKAAKAYAGGDREFECRIRGRDEIAQLQRAIKSMTEEIERKNTYNREFLATAAHELKTPLAAIQAAAEVLAGGACDKPEARAKFLANIDFETRRLDRLVGELRELTRYDAESVRRQSELCDCDRLIEETLERIIPTLPDEKPRIVLHKSGLKLALRVVPDQIEQLLANLLENAVRYTPAQASIEITLARGENDSAMIVVRDEGCGIEPGLRERVFDQFVTSEARNGGSHGSGLGLTIARSIVENHGGTISVSSSPGQGAVFAINLPLARRR